MRFFFSSILVMIGLLCVQCAREVIIDLPEEETKIVAICHFTPGQPFRIKINLSQSVNDGSDPFPPSAVDVSVSKEGFFLDKLFQKGTGRNAYWESRDTVEAGVRYSMAARIAGMPLAEASSFVPQHIPIQPISVLPEEVTVVDLDEGYKALRIPLSMELSSLPPGAHYFAFNLTTDIDVLEFIDSIPVVDFTYENEQAGYSADGRTLALLHTIAEPVVLINEKYWGDGVKTLNVNALVFYRPAQNERPRRLYIEWRTLSEEFYRYHLSVARQGNNLPLSDPDAVFNNISGGYGNFSGYSVSTDTIELPFR
ncbi:MAG: DUF4249 family protein [Saprospiraceae bacterium]|nr:DUF4249 family protein [Saprospiraceae bacterium]